MGIKKIDNARKDKTLRKQRELEAARNRAKENITNHPPITIKILDSRGREIRQING